MTPACLVGVGETRYARWGEITDASEHQLACEAIRAAVDDAGFTMDQVDGLGSFAGDRNEAVILAADLGLPALRYADMSWLPGGGGGCAAVATAAVAVEAGVASVIVVYRALCQGQFQRFGRAPTAAVPRSRGEHKDGASPLRRATGLLEAQMGFTLPFGMVNAPIAYALVMRRHMHRYGTTSAQMGAVAVACRAHAQRNPRAVMRERPMTLADHQRSRMIADPFRLYDCCLESDGACAVVVTTAERAVDARAGSVRVLAHSQGAAPRYGYGPFVNASMDDAVYASGGAAQVARRLWESAPVGPDDVDVAQIYDHFTGLVLLALEDFGCCAAGEGGALAASGALAWPHGRLPINTHGGSLSEAYMHGLNHVVEGVRQLRGESTCQVPACEICLVTSAAGVPTSALLLGRS
jgi:acetyl-CoA acetyltransferase